MILSLAMYALPGVGAATEDWMTGIARHLERTGFERPRTALPDDPSSLWRSGDLLLTQTCGYPVTHAYADALRPLMAPTYRALGCSPGHYSSWIITNSGSGITTLRDTQGKRLAINGFDSQSGWNALAADLTVAFRDAEAPPLASIHLTGGHALSLKAVQDGTADFAALDAVTATLIQHTQPDAFNGVQRIGFTRSAPSLPYATPRTLSDKDRASVGQALRAAMVDPALAPARSALLLADMLPVDDPSYDGIKQMAHTAWPPDRLAAAIR